MAEYEKLAYGSYLLENGKRAIFTCPVSDEEIEAYKKYPDTFFGVPRNQGRKANDPDHYARLRLPVGFQQRP